MTGTRTHRRLVGLLLALTTTAALAACSSGTDSGGDSESAGEAGAAREFGAQEDAPAERSAGDTATAGKRAAVRLERSIISTGTVSLRADDVAEARRAVQRVVDSERGEVGDENTDSDEDGRVVYARLVLRIPSDRFDEAMTDLEGIADLRHSERSAEDVTTQVIDTDVRVRAQQASLRRVEALLARADTLQQIIWIESQLTERRAELDSLRQQQAWLADQTTMSTITVDIERTPEADADDDDGAPGFLAGLEGGWKALVASTATLLTVLGAVLPFAVVALVVGVPVWLLVRRGARRRRTA